MGLPLVRSEHTHHDRVIHASHLEDVHRDLCAVGDLIAACVVGWREVEVGAVGLPVEKVTAGSQPPGSPSQPAPPPPSNVRFP